MKNEMKLKSEMYGIYKMTTTCKFLSEFLIMNTLTF